MLNRLQVSASSNAASVIFIEPTEYTDQATALLKKGLEAEGYTCLGVSSSPTAYQSGLAFLPPGYSPSTFYQHLVTLYQPSALLFCHTPIPLARDVCYLYFGQNEYPSITSMKIPAKLSAKDINQILTFLERPSH